MEKWELINKYHLIFITLARPFHSTSPAFHALAFAFICCFFLKGPGVCGEMLQAVVQFLILSKKNYGKYHNKSPQG
ncbi:CLUMA_CG009796, isoform A [Clunio marinus]|uniref:CLUMA_CG009796, isoform A n=1 Tax=Clunio marinus TaxID=568069 RepID=A0A1J1I842_9DIPT|nr:CLUMA_CG009796, isoform A [Clunio marinus]